jgi:hypothetical protein
MKKTLKALLVIVGIAALIMGGAENPDGSCNLVLTLSCIGIVALCAVGYHKLEGRSDV